MKHIFLLLLRLALLVIALYAVSNGLKELLLQEDDPLDATLLVLFNMLIAAVCWSLGCWRPVRKPRAAQSLGEVGTTGLSRPRERITAMYNQSV